MDNRFGFRDLIICLLLIGVIVTLVLGMYQDQRHWAVLKGIQSTLDEQTGQLADVQRSLRRGVATRGTPSGADGRAAPGSATQPAPDRDPFHRLRQATNDKQFARGDWVIDSFGSQIDSLTPLVSSDAYSSLIQDLVIETLAERDVETLEWMPVLARRWEVEDKSDAYLQWREEKSAALKTRAEQNPSVYQAQLEKGLKGARQRTDEPIKEGTEAYQQIVAQARQQWIREKIEADPERPKALRITFWLREGLNFSDGEALTAEDLAYTFDMIMNPRIAAPRQRSYYGRTIEDVKALSPNKVQFIFKRPYFEAFQLAATLPALPKHYYQPIVEADPEKFNQGQSLLLGSGPFQLRQPGQWSPGDNVILVRNNRYWGVPSPIKRLVFKIYTSDVAEMTAFRNQETDMFSPSPEQYEQLLKDEELTSRTRDYEYMTPFNGYRFIAWNQRDGNGDPTFFADRRVRQAMTLLTNRPRLLEKVQLGYGQIATGPFNPLGEQPSPKVEPWPYDPSRAKSLLREAGFTHRDDDGVLEGPNGEEFRFELTYPADNPNYEKMVMFLKDAYAKAGIVLEPGPLEWSVMVQRLNNSSFEAITLMWTSGPETDINQMFHSDQIKPGGDNFMAYRSPELDQRITEARHTMDKDQRLEIWRRCHQIIHEDQPYTFLFWDKSLRFIDDRFRNVHRFDAGMNSREEWFVPKNEQRWTQ